MTKLTACVWCLKIVSVPNTYNDLQNKAVCSPACRAAEETFMRWMSDEAINQRVHYAQLTQGK